MFMGTTRKRAMTVTADMTAVLTACVADVGITRRCKSKLLF
jgi:hypothetical protein